MKSNNDDPGWVCTDCGEKYGKGPQRSVSCYHLDTCSVCGLEKACTEARDFGYLRPEWKKEKRSKV